MPETPGTSARNDITSVSHQNPDRSTDPTKPVKSSTYDPFFGIEAGREVPQAAGTVSGGDGNDTL